MMLKERTNLSRNHFVDGQRDHNNPNANGQQRASSSDIQAKLDLLVEAAVARGRVRRPETLAELDTAALEYWRVARKATIEREHAYGICNPLSCVLCERENERRDSEEET